MEGLIDYSRQQEFNSTFRNNMDGWFHAIIGCGGVGFWLGIILAMQGYNNFTLFDGQILEPSNMNRIPVPPQWIGFKKVTALRKIIKQLRPETNIVNFPNHITEDNLDILGKMMTDNGMAFIIWDCTDDARIQRKVYDWSKTRNIQYRKIGYEGFTAGSYKNYDVWTSPDYQPGYRTSNACAASSAFAAVMGFMAQGLGISYDVNLDIRKILGKPQELTEETVLPSPGLGVAPEGTVIRTGESPLIFNSAIPIDTQEAIRQFESRREQEEIIRRQEELVRRNRERLAVDLAGNEIFSPLGWAIDTTRHQPNTIAEL